MTLSGVLRRKPDGGLRLAQPSQLGLISRYFSPSAASK